jgi:hypothetical protein
MNDREKSFDNSFYSDNKSFLIVCLYHILGLSSAYWELWSLNCTTTAHRSMAPGSRDLCNAPDQWTRRPWVLWLYGLSSWESSRFYIQGEVSVLVLHEADVHTITESHDRAIKRNDLVSIDQFQWTTWLVFLSKYKLGLSIFLTVQLQKSGMSDWYMKSVGSVVETVCSSNQNCL